MRYAICLSSLFWIALGVVTLPPAGEAQSGLPGRPVVGVAPAIVVDTTDPEATGRVKVVFPWLRDRAEAETWARVSLPLGGNSTGFWALPEAGDEVLLAFEHGDLQRPVILGSLWNGATPPPGGGGNGASGLTSPDGRFSINVTDDGITLRGPTVVVQLNASQLIVNAEDTLVSSVNQTNMISGAATNINGAVIRLNGSGCPPIARVGDRVQFGELSVIVTGSTTVTSC